MIYCKMQIRVKEYNEEPRLPWRGFEDGAKASALIGKKGDVFQRSQNQNFSSVNLKPFSEFHQQLQGWPGYSHRLRPFYLRQRQGPCA